MPRNSTAEYEVVNCNGTVCDPGPFNNKWRAENAVEELDEAYAGGAPHSVQRRKTVTSDPQ